MWGKMWYICDVIVLLVKLNPLRYRGYVYDAETGIYYVASRYYDPERESRS